MRGATDGLRTTGELEYFDSGGLLARVGLLALAMLASPVAGWWAEEVWGGAVREVCRGGVAKAKELFAYCSL